MHVFVCQERIPVEEVFEQLKCTRGGLTNDEGEKRLQIFGPNKLEEKKDSKLLKFLGFMWNPLSWVMECAAIMAIALANGGVTTTVYTKPTFSFSLFLNDLRKTLKKIIRRAKHQIGKTSLVLWSCSFLTPLSVSLKKIMLATLQPL